MDTSDLIFSLVQSNPGIHFRALVNLSNKPIGVVEYHLRQMEIKEKIISVRHRSHKLFFDTLWEDKIGELKIIINNLRKSIPRKILLFLSQDQQNQHLSIKEVASKLNQSPSNFHWHIKRMIEDKLVEPVRRGREVILKLILDEEIINTLGKEIFPTRWDKFLDEIDFRFNH